MNGYNIRKWHLSQWTAATECFIDQGEFEAMRTPIGRRALCCDKE